MCTNEMQMILDIVIKVLDVIRFFVPILLIILCTIDIFKIIVTKKDDQVKKLRKDIFMKIFYAILIYLIPFLIPLVFRLINNLLPINYDNSWQECWNLVKENKKMNQKIKNT